MSALLWGGIFFVVIVIIVIIVIVFINPSDAKLANINPLLSSLGPSPAGGAITNCSMFAAQRAVRGAPNGPMCKTGTQEFGAICYTDVWTNRGGTKTAVCTVDYGPFGGVVTRCGVGIAALNIGDPCPMIGQDYYKTAVCTCQLKGVITASQYCQSQGMPDQCPPGWDFLADNCFAEACPNGFVRTEVCTCTPVSVT